MRRSLTVLSSVALIVGMTLGVSAPVQAADLGTVTVTGTPANSVSPTFLNAQVGDTFRINNASGSTIAIQGPVSRLDDPRDCRNPDYCTVSIAASPRFRVDAADSFAIRIYVGGGGFTGTLIATVSLSGGSQGGSSPTPIVLPPVLFTLGYDANGGTCSVTNSGPVESTAWTSVPTAEQCTRPGYTLLGWNPRSDGGDPLGFSPGGSTQMTGDNTLYAIWQAVPAAAPPTTSVQKSITIFGERGKGDASNRIFIEGISTGLPAGTDVIPYLRFPGETGFTAGIPTTTDADGNFRWSRKTGKRVAVRFRTADGSVTSNQIVIDAR
jgi:hypothetical protein